MEHICSLCPYFSSSVDDLCQHFRRRHRNAAHFIIHCSACGASFRNTESFRSHYYRKHPHVPDSMRSPVIDEMDLDLSSEIPDLSADCTAFDEAAFVLKLKAKHRLSHSAISDIMQSTKELVQSKLLTFHRDIGGNATDGDSASQLDRVVSLSDNMFVGLNNKYQQRKSFEKLLGFIQPVEVKLGKVVRNKKNAGKYSVKHYDATGYIVPFIQQVTQLLSLPEVYACINETKVIDEDLMTDYYDGISFQRDSLFQSNANALAIALYTDDFEIVNPIGTHRKKHKITAFYWSLLNIPVEYRSQLRVIQLAALAKSSHAKQFGFKQFVE